MGSGLVAKTNIYVYLIALTGSRDFSLMFKHVESFFKMGRGDVQRESFPEK